MLQTEFGWAPPGVKLTATGKATQRKLIDETNQAHHRFPKVVRAMVILSPARGTPEMLRLNSWDEGMKAGSASLMGVPGVQARFGVTSL